MLLCSYFEIGYICGNTSQVVLPWCQVLWGFTRSESWGLDGGGHALRWIQISLGERERRLTREDIQPHVLLIVLILTSPNPKNFPGEWIKITNTKTLNLFRPHLQIWSWHLMKRDPRRSEQKRFSPCSKVIEFGSEGDGSLEISNWIENGSLDASQCLRHRSCSEK